VSDALPVRSKILIFVHHQSHGIHFDVHVLPFLIFQLLPHLSNVDLFLRLGTIVAKMSFGAAIEAGGVLEAIDIHRCAVSLGHGSFFRGDGSDVVFGLS
jgi:hypothetical protein